MHTIYPATSFSVSISYPSADYPAPTYSTGTGTQQANGWAFYTSNALLHLPDFSDGAGLPSVLAVHGSNNTALSAFAPGTGTWGDYVRSLVDSGFAVLACDTGALPVGNNLALQVLDQAYSYLTGITGATTVGVMGSSAGGLASLVWAQKRSTQVGGVFLINPLIDLDTQRGTSGWTTPWSIGGGDPNAGITYATPSATITNGAFLCSDDTGFTTNAINQGHCPNRNPTGWAGMNISVNSAELDETIPYQQSAWWVGAVGSPSVTFASYPTSVGRHQPSSLLAGGDGDATDATTISNGGMPRKTLRDFFYSVL